MIPLIKEHKESCEQTKIYQTCKKRSNIIMLMIKIIINLKAIVIILVITIYQKKLCGFSQWIKLRLQMILDF